METETKKQFTDLEFVRVTQPLLFHNIPKYLFEQVKDRSFDINRLYRLSERLLLDPTNLFYVLIDEEKQIKGIFWANANVIDNSIDVSLLSIDKEYQFGSAIKETLKFIDTFQKDATIRILTSRIAKYRDAGFKKTKTMMVIENKEYNHGRNYRKRARNG